MRDIAYLCYNILFACLVRLLIWPILGTSEILSVFRFCLNIIHKIEAPRSLSLLCLCTFMPKQQKLHNILKMKLCCQNSVQKCMVIRFIKHSVFAIRLAASLYLYLQPILYYKNIQCRNMASGFSLSALFAATHIVPYPAVLESPHGRRSST